jgi:hypothetical protein
LKKGDDLPRQARDKSQKNDSKRGVLCHKVTDGASSAIPSTQIQHGATRWPEHSTDLLTATTHHPMLLLLVALQGQVCHVAAAIQGQELRQQVQQQLCLLAM